MERTKNFYRSIRDKILMNRVIYRFGVNETESLSIIFGLLILRLSAEITREVAEVHE